METIPAWGEFLGQLLAVFLTALVAWMLHPLTKED